jgi:hypothetical protein
LFRDFKAIGEWKARFRVGLAACRGVFGHSFVNNWVNGTLYAFPFKNNRYYTSPLGSNPNSPYNVFCDDSIILHETNNFYYRSSPYQFQARRFIGRDGYESGRNNKEIMFPTTITDLGPRDYFTYELVLNENYYGYNMEHIHDTSYQDTTELLNLYILSRQISSNWLQNILGLGDGSINGFFSRYRRRFDGDYAQTISINSELGVKNFSFDTYTYIPGGTAGGNTWFIGDHVLGIFYSSDTQTRDYVSPRRIIRDDFAGVFDTLPMYSQFTPFYQWYVKDTNTIFGNENNDWKTNKINAWRYQSMDRNDVTFQYYMGETNLPIFNTGYIYNVKPVANTSPVIYEFEGDYNGQHFTNKSPVTVGAPFHFYFGLRKGASAIDRFYVKYLGREDV